MALDVAAFPHPSPPPKNVEGRSPPKNFYLGRSDFPVLRKPSVYCPGTSKRLISNFGALMRLLVRLFINASFFNASFLD